MEDTCVAVLEECVCVCVCARARVHGRSQGCCRRHTQSSCTLLPSRQQALNPCLLNHCCTQKEAPEARVQGLLTSLGVSVSSFAPASAVQVHAWVPCQHDMSPVWEVHGHTTSRSQSCTFMNKGRHLLLRFPPPLQKI